MCGDTYMLFVCQYELYPEKLNKAIKSFAGWGKVSAKSPDQLPPVKIVGSYWLFGDQVVEIVDAPDYEAVYHWFFPIMRYIRKFRISPAVPWDEVINKFKPLYTDKQLPEDARDPDWIIPYNGPELGIMDKNWEHPKYRRIR
jgi:hypothetical protein